MIWTIQVYNTKFAMINDFRWAIVAECIQITIETIYEIYNSIYQRSQLCVKVNSNQFELL